jgi:hypothetical protein
LDRARASVSLIDRVFHGSIILPLSNMATVQDEGSVPAVRFKRRKVAHAKRVQGDQEMTAVSDSHAPSVESRIDAPSPFEEPLDEADSVPNLKDIIRNRKRPRDRLKDTARKAEAPRSELVSIDAPQDGHYTSRFVAQTGQVVDRDDKQM